MKGKNILITGANSGIGKATAISLAKKGATIYMVCRSGKRALEAKNEIIKKTQNPNIHIFLCDLSSMGSIQEYGEKLRESVSHLDVVINNAGAMFGSRMESIDGLEMTFALNHIGYFLNTHYCLDLLRKGEMKRIVNVASIGHKTAGKLDFSDLQSKKGTYRQFVVYGRSKLYNIYFNTILAEKIEHEGITVNCLHPGVVSTNFGQSANWYMKLALPLGRKFMISPQKGCFASVYLASSPEVKGVTGKYFDKKKIIKPSKDARNKVYAQQIWDQTQQICGIQTFGEVE